MLNLKKKSLPESDGQIDLYSKLFTLKSNITEKPECIIEPNLFTIFSDKLCDMKSIQTTLFELIA